MPFNKEIHFSQITPEAYSYTLTLGVTSPDGQNLGHVYVEQRVSAFRPDAGIETTVNWSCTGSVSPAAALEFAETLRYASTIARNLQHHPLTKGQRRNLLVNAGFTIEEAQALVNEGQAGLRKLKQVDVIESQGGARG